MQNESWRQPAMQITEAVLLPALEQRSRPASHFGSRYLSPAVPDDVFKPADESWGFAAQPAVSNLHVPPKGSMAGRSILRSVGVLDGPIWVRPRRASLRSFRR